MNERMDAGDIILKKEAKIDEDDTNITLSEKLSSLGADILQEAMSLIEKGKANFLKQDEAEATYAPKLKKEDGLIGWNEDALAIRNKVRGLIPWPGAYTFLDGKILKIWQADALAPSDRKGGAKPGEVVDIEKGKGIIVRAGSGDIAIKYLQLESGKIMDADSFLRGHHLALHHVLQGRS
jgi:methionyl-tRNA formyltransferase